MDYFYCSRLLITDVVVVQAIGETGHLVRFHAVVEQEQEQNIPRPQNLVLVKVAIVMLAVCHTVNQLLLMMKLEPVTGYA